jgi:hypothetical protein
MHQPWLVTKRTTKGMTVAAATGLPARITKPYLQSPVVSLYVAQQSKP